MHYETVPLGRYPPATTTESNSVWDLRVDCRPCMSGNCVCNNWLTACICRSFSIPLLTTLLSMQRRSKLGFHTLFLETFLLLFGGGDTGEETEGEGCFGGRDSDESGGGG